MFVFVIKFCFLIENFDGLVSMVTLHFVFVGVISHFDS